MPVLGIVASQISGHLFAPSGAYDSIATVTVGGAGSSSITFSSIPANYTHLQLRIMNLSNSSGNSLNTIFNGDTGSNYPIHALYGNGATVSVYGFASQTAATGGIAGTSTYPSVTVIDILDYANTSKYKTLRALSGYDSNNTANGYLFYVSAAWLNTSAINSINITGMTFAQYSSFALYGIKGA